MFQFFHNIAKKKEMDAPNFYHLLADGKLLMCVAEAVSPSIRYLWVRLICLNHSNIHMSIRASVCLSIYLCLRLN